MGQTNKASGRSKPVTGTQLAKIGSDDAGSRITLVEQELANLTKISETVYNTQDKRIMGCDIQKETKVENLLKVGTSIKQQKTAYDTYGDEMVAKGYIKGYPVFEVEGVSAEGILKDIELRLQILSTDERRKKLEKITSGYRELLDKSDKLRMLDAELNDFLGNQ